MTTGCYNEYPVSVESRSKAFKPKRQSSPRVRTKRSRSLPDDRIPPIIKLWILFFKWVSPQHGIKQLTILLQTKSSLLAQIKILSRNNQWKSSPISPNYKFWVQLIFHFLVKSTHTVRLQNGPVFAFLQFFVNSLSNCLSTHCPVFAVFCSQQ